MLSSIAWHSLHQTRLSRRIRQIPAFAGPASRFWIRHQTRAFWSAFESRGLLARPETRSPLTCSSEDKGHGAFVTVDRHSGEEFSRLMGEVSVTDKFFAYGYQNVYGPSLDALKLSKVRVLEIGIGVPDPSAPSGMSRGHVAGSSLRGWAHYFPHGEIHGADIDSRVLIDCDAYSTHYVDQRDLASLSKLADEIGTPLDVVVDDGLHTPEANANTVASFLPALSEKGLLFVEDVLPEFEFLWRDLYQVLHGSYCMRFFAADELGARSINGLVTFWRNT